MIKTDVSSLIELILRTKRKELIEFNKNIAVNFNKNIAVNFNKNIAVNFNKNIAVNFNKNIAVNFNKNSDNYFIFANPKTLREILDNVINNAIYAVKSDGKIDISLISKNNSLIIKVTDDGEGIKQEILKKIFEKGFSTKNKKRASGLGLGLYQSKREIEKIGGSIKINSKKSAGTEVTIALNSLQDDLVAVKAKKKLIMVDDDIFLLKTAKKSFEQIGYNVVTFDSPESIITKIDQLDKSSIVLYDMKFENSNIDGLQLRKKFIEIGFKSCQLVLISALADKISSRSDERIQSVSKSNFDDILNLVREINPALD